MCAAPPPIRPERFLHRRRNRFPPPCGHASSFESPRSATRTCVRSPRTTRPSHSLNESTRSRPVATCRPFQSRLTSKSVPATTVAAAQKKAATNICGGRNAATERRSPPSQKRDVDGIIPARGIQGARLIVRPSDRANAARNGYFSRTRERRSTVAGLCRYSSVQCAPHRFRFHWSALFTCSRVAAAAADPNSRGTDAGRGGASGSGTAALGLRRLIGFRRNGNGKFRWNSGHWRNGHRRRGRHRWNRGNRWRGGHVGWPARWELVERRTPVERRAPVEAVAVGRLLAQSRPHPGVSTTSPRASRARVIRTPARSRSRGPRFKTRAAWCRRETRWWSEPGTYARRDLRVGCSKQAASSAPSRARRRAATSSSRPTLQRHQDPSSSARKTPRPAIAFDLEPGSDFVDIVGFSITSDGTVTKAGVKVAGSTGSHGCSTTPSPAWAALAASSSTTASRACSSRATRSPRPRAPARPGHGMYLSGASTGVKVLDNSIHDNAYVGIHVNGDISEGGAGVVTGATIAGNPDLRQRPERHQRRWPARLDHRKQRDLRQCEKRHRALSNRRPRRQPQEQRHRRQLRSDQSNHGYRDRDCVLPVRQPRAPHRLRAAASPRHSTRARATWRSTTCCWVHPARTTR